MARAIELKHSAGLCSALAHETSKMFTTAADALRTLDMSRVERWSRYLQLKAAVYTAYVSRTRGQGLWAEWERWTSVPPAPVAWRQGGACGVE